jgi:ABC-type multidrug transport system ATPase subunit
MNIIETNDLDFQYRDHKVLSNLNLAVPEKTIYGFLGPNGAGKSTTIRALLGLVQVGSDKVRLFGKDITKHRLEISTKIYSVTIPISCRTWTQKITLSLFTRLWIAFKTTR